MHGSHISVKICSILLQPCRTVGREVKLPLTRSLMPMFMKAQKDLKEDSLTILLPDLWQNDTSVARNSWVIQKETIIRNLRISFLIWSMVSKKRCLASNIGPKPDGTIPAEDTQILREIGKWLKVNGEAIYGTRYWKVFGEGPTVSLRAILQIHMKRNSLQRISVLQARGKSYLCHGAALAGKWKIIYKKDVEFISGF